MKRSGKMRRRYRWILVGALMLFLICVSAALWIGLTFYMEIRKDLPDLAQLKDYRPSLITKVYSDSGDVIGKFFIEKRILLEYEDLPERLIKAFIAIEDARFYHHNGVDIQGISRAFWTNLRAKQIAQGGSTITQQLAKTLFLSPEKTIRRKVKEVILALQIEKRYSKEEILELYLNQIYFGAGAYGVEAAAQTYFGKHVADLTIAQMALLAGLPKSPRRFDPIKHPERSTERRSVVLARMYGEHFISLNEKNSANEEPLYLIEEEKCRDVSAYFVEHVRRYLMGKYGSQQLYSSGLDVHTTLDLKLQHAAAMAVREGLREYDKRHGYRGPLGQVTLEELAGVKNEGQEEGVVDDGDREDPNHEDESKPFLEDKAPFCVNDILEGIVVDVVEAGAWVSVLGKKGLLPFEELKWAKKENATENRTDPDKIEWIEPKTPMDVLSIGDRILARILTYDPETSELTLSLEQEPEVQGALISLDPSTGGIKAMIGGYDYEKSEFNRAVQAKRQPGSAFKPFIYGAAIMKGFSPSTIIIDTPIIFSDSEMDEKWKPANYSEKFYGPTRLRVALAKSRNVITVRLLQKIGIKTVIDFANRLGISNPLAKDYSLALGSSVLNLLELTSAYAVFSNQGKRAEPLFIKQILDYDGNVIEENNPIVEDVLDTDISYIITNMLEEVVKNGTGYRMRQLGRPSAGKTGTTNDFLDALYVGFVPNMVTGVWVGFDDMRSLGKGESGSKAAGPIWLSFMKEGTQDKAVLPFAAPSGVAFVRVDKETGLLPSSDKQETYFECFRKGSEPREYAPAKRKLEDDFFDMDSHSLRSAGSGDSMNESVEANQL